MHPRLFSAISCDPFYAGQDGSLPFFNGKSGERLFDMPGDAPRRVSRAKLRAFLGEGLDVQVSEFASGLWKAWG